MGLIGTGLGLMFIAFIIAIIIIAAIILLLMGVCIVGGWFVLKGLSVIVNN